VALTSPLCTQRKATISGASKLKKKKSVTSVGERTIPTERPPLVSEIRGNFCGQRVLRGQSDGSLRPYFRFSRPEAVQADLVKDSYCGPSLHDNM
jgi:hypothetical protein